MTQANERLVELGQAASAASTAAKPAADKAAPEDAARPAAEKSPTEVSAKPAADRSARWTPLVPSPDRAIAERSRGQSASSAALDLDAEPAVAASPPLWKRWPLWVGVGAAAVAATILVVAVSGDDPCEGACVDFR